MLQLEGHGLVITSKDGRPLRHGNFRYWDAELSNIVQDALGDYFPEVRVEHVEKNEPRIIIYTTAGGELRASSQPVDKDIDEFFKATFYQDDSHGRELCGISQSFEDENAYVPSHVMQDFINRLDNFHKISEQEHISEGARGFIRSFSLPNPASMKNAWRVSNDVMKTHLFVLWGYFRDGNDTILPLTPTSSKWEDANRRVNLLNLPEIMKATRLKTIMALGVLQWLAFFYKKIRMTFV